MENVLNFLNSLNISKNEYVVVACSGGPDSMFLLNLLHELNYKIICAHVNHKVRKESDDEFIFVKKFCDDKGIIFEGIELTGYESGNFEHYARQFRYDYFESILKKYDSKYLFTAHHGDDLIETILMRLVRGSSLKGYSGFNKITIKDNYKIVRPLIYLTKDYIEECNKNNNIPYVIDNTNYTDEYTRNRYRHHVLPFLKEEDNNVHEKFILFNEELTRAWGYLDTLVNNYMNDMFKDNKLNIVLFNDLDDYMKYRLIYNILSLLYPDNLYLVDSNHINEILKIIKSDKPNIDLVLPNNIYVKKNYDYLEFLVSLNNSLSNYEMEYEDGISINGYRFINCDKSLEDNSNFVIRLSSKDIKLPLKIRTRLDGDKMVVKNMNGSKKINDIFIDMKVSKDKRDAWPILVDANNEILWVPGLKKSKFDVPKSEEYDIILKYEKEERD